MGRRRYQRRLVEGPRTSERGSSLILALFVLVMLSAMGVALLAGTQIELQMAQASVRSSTSFYLADAAIEAGRQELFNTNGDGAFGDDLVTAAGADAVLDFDPAAITPVYDVQGELTGLAGYDDDVALLALAQLGDGWYAAFLTNDPGEAGGIAATADANDRVMITGVGSSGDGSFEVVQAIIEPKVVFPSEVPATITMLGPTPSFSDVDDATKLFTGDDCNGAGIPGFKVPVVGLVSNSAELLVEGALSANTQYVMDSQTGHWTIANVDDSSDSAVINSDIGTIGSDWTDCEALAARAEEIRGVADVVCTDGTSCPLPPSAPDRVIFVDDDFQLAGVTGEGMLWVTGTLTMNGTTNWNGLIVVVGEGVFRRLGVGTGVLSGGTVLAHIAGPDNIYGNSDDCTGGTDGFGSTDYDESLGGTGVTTYCSSEIQAATPYTRYAIVEFRQR